MRDGCRYLTDWNGVGFRYGKPGCSIVSGCLALIVVEFFDLMLNLDIRTIITPPWQH